MMYHRTGWVLLALFSVPVQAVASTKPVFPVAIQGVWSASGKAGCQRRSHNSLWRMTYDGFTHGGITATVSDFDYPPELGGKPRFTLSINDGGQVNKVNIVATMGRGMRPNRMQWRDAASTGGVTHFVRCR